jgi:predicted esterase
MQYIRFVGTVLCHALFESVPRWHKHSLLQKCVFHPPVPEYAANDRKYIGTNVVAEIEKTPDNTFYMHLFNVNKSHLPTKQLICFFHGNSDNIKDNTYNLHNLLEHVENSNPLVDWHIVSPEYKGYDPETYLQKCDEFEIESSCRDVVLYWWNRLKLSSNEQLTVMGYSIGSAIATRIVMQMSCGKLILLAPFRTMRAVVRERFGCLASCLFGERFNTLANVCQAMQQETILIHSTGDEVIPIEHSERILDALRVASKPATLFPLEEGGHVNVPWTTISTLIAQFFVSSPTIPKTVTIASILANIVEPREDSAETEHFPDYD